jgi:hypothetical protein
LTSAFACHRVDANAPPALGLLSITNVQPVAMLILLLSKPRQHVGAATRRKWNDQPDRPAG